MGYIYKIYNNINNKVYIGQTTTTLENRFKEHKKAAMNNISCSLYNAMRKYGDNNFYIQEIEKCIEFDLNDREKYWIEYFDSYKNGYNDTIGGDGRKKYNYKEIADKYQELKSAKLTKDFFNCSYQVVQRACAEYNIKILSSGESKWLHATEEYKQNKKEKMKKLGKSLTGTKLTEEHKKKLSEAKKKSGKTRKVLCVETNEKFDSIEDARKKYNLKNSRCIRLSCKHNGEKYTSAGYHWQYIDTNYVNVNNKKSLNSKKIICLETGIIYDSAFDAMQKLKLNSCCGISKCCNGKLKTSAGFHWSFYNEN